MRRGGGDFQCCAPLRPIGELGAVVGDEAVAAVFGGDPGDVGHGATSAATCGRPPVPQVRKLQSRRNKVPYTPVPHYLGRRERGARVSSRTAAKSSVLRRPRSADHVVS